MFSAKRLAREYVDAGKLIGALKPAYTAKLEFDDFKKELYGICDISSMGSSASHIQISFQSDKIEMSTKNDVGSGKNTVFAVRIEGSADYSFYYPANKLKDIFKTIDGTMILQLDARGYLLVFDRCSKFMLTPVSNQAVMNQEAKYAEKKTKVNVQAA